MHIQKIHQWLILSEHNEYNDCQCALLLVDITEKESLKKIKELVKKIDIENNKYLRFLLIENKIDLESQRDISKDEINAFMEDNKQIIIQKIRLSVKNGQGFDELKEQINILVNKTENDFAICKVLQNKNEKVDDSEMRLVINLVLLGDSKVGKTAFYNRFNNNKFQEDIVSTIGVDKYVSTFKYKGYEPKVTLWDTAGQERYRSLSRSYYQNADGIFLLFDVTKKETFDNISIWMDQIKDNNKNQEKLTVYLIGNKIDDLERYVDKSEAEEKSKFLRLEYFEMSCKLNLNIMEVASKMIIDCYEKKFGDNVKEILDTTPSVHFDLKKGNKNAKNNKGCCGRT